MKSYELTKVDPLGEYDDKWGQRYWCKADGVDLPVSFNSKRRDWGNFTVVYAEEAEVKTSNSGNQYIQLRKVKFEDSGSPTADSSSAQNTLSMGDESGKRPTPAAGQDNKYLKDVSDMPFRVWQQLLNHFDVQNLANKPAEQAAFWESVTYHTNELLDIIDRVRSGGELKPKSLGDKFRSKHWAGEAEEAIDGN